MIPGLVFLSGALVNSTPGWEKIANGAAVLAFAILGVRTARLGIFAEPEHLVLPGDAQDAGVQVDVAAGQGEGFADPQPVAASRLIGAW